MKITALAAAHLNEQDTKVAGAKAHPHEAAFAARLKSCPDTKLVIRDFYYRLFAVICLLAIPASLLSQDIHVRVINGRTGKRIPNLYLGVPVPHSNLNHIHSDKGSDRFLLEIDPNNPIQIVTISSKTSGLADYGFCNKSVWHESFPDVKTILTTGWSSENLCSTKVVKANPGELILYVRRLHWWERMD